MAAPPPPPGGAGRVWVQEHEERVPHHHLPQAEDKVLHHPPPGSGPRGPNLLAQLVQAMQLAAAALPPPGPGAPPRVKIPLQFLKDYQEKDLKLI